MVKAFLRTFFTGLVNVLVFARGPKLAGVIAFFIKPPRVTAFFKLRLAFKLGLAG